MALPPGPSQLSASRPPSTVLDQTTAQLNGFSLSSPSSSRAPSPSSPAPTTEGGPQQPTLLSTLSANDGESILVLTVDELDQAAAKSGFEGSQGEQGKSKGRVYGGSQGGAIHVSPIILYSVAGLLLRSFFTRVAKRPVGRPSSSPFGAPILVHLS